MRHTRIVLALGVAAALFGLSACQTAEPSGGGAPTPNNAVVRVLMDEWDMTPSITSVPAGKVSFLAVNQGKVEHEVVVLKTDKSPKDMVMALGGMKVDETTSGETIGEVEVEAGATGASTFDLGPGQYVLICNVPEHYKAGMVSQITVTGEAVATTTAPVARKESPATGAPGTLGERKDITLVKAVRPTLVNTLEAAQKGDMAGARKAFAAYDGAWNGIEVYINFRSAQLYGELESDIQARLTKLLDDPQSNPADVVSTAREMLAKYDEAIKMVEDSPAISPLFDDLAALRIVRGDTIRNVGPALKAGDVAAAKAYFTQFLSRWADIEDLVKAYSTDAYADTEAAMAKANTAFQKTTPEARELDALVAETLARYNFGVSLLNAAARNADMAKTTYTAGDLQLAAGVAAIQAALNNSLPLWQAGRYQESADHARRASGELFAAVSGALRAKNSADAALQKALDAYAAAAGQPGDATTVRAAQKAAIGAAAVAQQALVGQFWTDPRFKDGVKALRAQ